MKRCPQCGREYDASMMFCLDDGAELLYGPASAHEPATAILHETAPLSEGATRAQIHATAAEPRDTLNEASAEPRKGPDRRLLLVPIAFVVVVLGGFFGYRYFTTDDSRTINSVAVLPFENRSNDPEADYLSDGLAESLIFRLSQLPGLKVSPTSSVMQYKGRAGNLATIASDLGVRAVMTGKLVQRGDNLTISIELIDVPNNKLLWGEQYDRKMSDLLATQREIAAAITQKLELKLAGDERGVSKRYTSNNEAYQLYLKGRFHFAKRTKEDLFKSIEILEQAVKLDPKFALGYVGIAESWAVIPSFPYASPAECMPKAKTAAQRALELDPELPEAHTVSAMIAATYDWDWGRAETGFKRALELDPNVSITHYRYAWTYLSPMGRHDEAIAEMKIAMEKEPLYLIQGANYAAVLMYARRFDEAVEQARKTYDLDPNFIGSINWLGHTNAAKGNYAEALSMAASAPDSDMPLRAAAGYVYAKTGQRDKALANIRQWKEIEKKRYVQNYWLAIAYAALGDKDSAFAELERAYQNRDWFLQRIKVDPFMDPLRDDTRFKDLLKRMNLPE